MGTEILAGMLLVARLAVVAYLAKVISIQVRLRRHPAVDDNGYIDKDVAHFRTKLFLMTVAMLAGNFIPIALDGLIILQHFGIGEHIRTTPVLLVYAASNAFTMLTAAAMINKMYALANEAEEVTELERKALGK